MENNLSEKVEKILKKIRETRKNKGLSHESMAFELDISPSAYNKLEHSVTTLSLERFLKIAEILNIPLSDAFDIKTGDIIHDIKDNAIGKVETLYQENKETNEKFIQSLQNEIQFLRELLAKTTAT
jgi:transcriptional regulator with XRE-family HTH domain